MAGLLCPPAVRTLPFPSPILPPSLFPCSGRYKRGMVSELRALQQPGLEWRLLVGLTNIPRGPRGLPMIAQVYEEGEIVIR
eukprot:scaffold27399_cov131-Isochrysis_galbana.AAC.1